MPPASCGLTRCSRLPELDRAISCSADLHWRRATTTPGMVFGSFAPGTDGGFAGRFRFEFLPNDFVGSPASATLAYLSQMSLDMLTLDNVSDANL